jgi:hypothetical protein
MTIQIQRLKFSDHRTHVQHPPFVFNLINLKKNVKKKRE